MKKHLIILGCISLLLLSTTTAHAQFLTPTQQLQTTTTTESPTILIGSTQLTSISRGYPLEFASEYDTDSIEDLITLIEENPMLASIIDTSYLRSLTDTLADETSATPLLGKSTLTGITQLTIIPEDLLTLDFETMTLTQLADAFESLQRFENVTIEISHGPSIISTGTKALTSTIDTDFAINALFSFPLQNTSYPTLGIYSPDNLISTASDSSAVLIQPTSNGTLIVKDTTGTIIWNEDTSDKIFLFDYADLTIDQNASIFVIPLTHPTHNITIGKLTVQKSTTPFPTNLTTIINDLTNDLSFFTEATEIDTLTQPLELAQTIITNYGEILNGAGLLINVSTVTVNNQPQDIDMFCFFRGEPIYIDVISDSPPLVRLKTETTFLLLTDHLYNPQAPDDAKGLSIPLFPLPLWIIAIGLHIAFKKQREQFIDEYRDQRLQKLGFPLLIVSIIGSIILVDLELQAQLGISAGSSLLGGGILLVTGGLILFEFVLVLLGFLTLYFPLTIILHNLFLFLKINKAGKTFARAISIQGLWIATAMFTPLLINIILLFVGNIIPTT